MAVGVLAGIGGVAALAKIGPTIPLHLRCAVLSSLAAVLLAPALVAFSILARIVLPFSLEGILGDGLWSRVARANIERRFGPLLLPFLFFVGLPMTLGFLGGSKLTALTTPMVIGAGLGAVALGALVGGVCGSVLGGRRPGA
jgi:hypothetical protein